ncbi:septal ring lytic transglycosylase RlpA family protein [uncultured Gilvimarinus sp.]|uniref:septal ring lytic transglycosylase RlpA family protein n=1 Tax=uncultured Gilvimarinus sp. TaxID=1689143 RepID=UPI0030EDD0F3|tara:strand:+ start:2965 stop:3354 length:390 start_codon:yes stop_codon:yes gene_type:complete
MTTVIKYLPLGLLLAIVGACSSVESKSPEHLLGYAERGEASFYAAKFQFRKTASGERFNQLAKTAAHRTLPFGTKVRVTNLENGRDIVVKINDRGPFIPGRVIDLSRSAFSELADTKVGLIDVKLEVVP